MAQTVLVVDDVRINRMFLVKLLRPKGFKVLEAGDGEVALRMIREIRPDIVLLDIMMPFLDGIECCRIVKSDPELRATKVLMVTSRAEGDQVKQAFNAGCDGYIIKPVDKAELLSKVSRLSRLCSARSHLRTVLHAG